MAPIDRPPDPSRRRVLAGLGALGLTLGHGPGLLHTAPAGARPARVVSPSVAAQAAQASDALTLDTFSGIVAFVCPGDDAYSRQQQVAPAEPGGIAAEAPQLLADTLNTYFPVPEVLAFLVEALSAELSAVPLPDGLDGLTWLDGLLETDGHVPLAPLVAVLVDMLAVQVRPSSAAGPFLTPFPRLSWPDKAEVWRRFESDLPNLFTVGAPGTRLPVLSTIPACSTPSAGCCGSPAGRSSKWPRSPATPSTPCSTRRRGR